MREVQLYIEGQRVELFNDELISVTSSIQNISDITKIYTDFSQGFTVPASPPNNQIFKHFYQSDVNSDVTQTIGFDHNIRRKAYIEIDLSFFRRGKISLEKANLKNGAVESYTITFYGDIRTLKDAFGELKLKDLDHSAYNHTYNGTEVKNRITDGVTDYDVRYPLISSSREWEYNEGAAANDIKLVAGKIHYSELMPALKVKAIFAMIQAQFGVTFTGLFLLTQQFTKLFQYYKNKVGTGAGAESTAPVDVDFLSTTTPIEVPTYNSVDLVANTLNYTYAVAPSVNFDAFLWITEAVIYTNLPSETYYIDVYRNGVISHTVTGVGNATHTVYTEDNTGNPSLNTTLSFKIRSVSVLEVNVIIRNYVSYVYLSASYTAFFRTISCGVINTILDTNLASLAPDIKIVDWFAGILKEFNLTCYGTADNVFKIEPLETWYSQGAVINITKYTDVSAIEIERVKLYKKISFEHEKSESLLNRNFATTNNREYGSLDNVWDYDGGDFIVKVPFENILFQKFTGTNLQVAYCLNESLAGYVPKPILLYQYTNKDVSFRFNDGASTTEITSYVPFGQDLLSNNSNFSLNFGQDVSSLLMASVPNSLYAIYYKAYLENLYNLKQRLTRVKVILPTSLLTSLQLNDRLIIRDKRYVINEMKTELTNGETNFTLLNDFRPVRSIQIVRPDKGSSLIKVPVFFINRTKSATITSDNIDATISPNVITEEQIVEVTIAANPNQKSIVTSENGTDIINSEDYFRIRSEEGDDRLITLTIDYVFEDGTTDQAFIYLIQES